MHSQHASSGFSKLCSQNIESYQFIFSRTENQSLKEELNEFKSSKVDIDIDSQREIEESNKVKELEEIVRHKNKQIRQLLDDIEEVLKEFINKKINLDTRTW